MPTPKLTNDALSFIKKMQPKHAKQVLIKIIDLRSNPFPPDSSELKGSLNNFRRTDCGEYRIIYTSSENELFTYLPTPVDLSQRLLNQPNNGVRCGGEHVPYWFWIYSEE